MHTVNNRRVWYYEQRLSYALFMGNTTLAKEVVEKVPKQNWINKWTAAGVFL
jgi:hypothetical protein